MISNQLQTMEIPIVLQNTYTRSTCPSFLKVVSAFFTSLSILFPEFVLFGTINLFSCKVGSDTFHVGKDINQLMNGRPGKCIISNCTGLSSCKYYTEIDQSERRKGSENRGEI